MDLIPVPTEVAHVAAAALDTRANRGGGGSARGVVIATALTTGWISPHELDELRAWHDRNPDDVQEGHSTLLAGLFGGSPAREVWPPTPLPPGNMPGDMPPATAALSPTAARLRRLSDRVNKTDRALVHRLHATANLALSEALRGAHVKLRTRARSRGKVQQAALAAALTGPSGAQPVTPAMLAAVGVTENELLDHRFDTYGTSAVALIAAAERRKLHAMAVELGLDDQDLEDEYGPTIDQRAAVAAGFITGALGQLARAALSGQSLTSTGPGEYAGPVPFGLIRNAWDVVDTGATPPRIDTAGPGPANVDVLSESFGQQSASLVEDILAGQDIQVQVRTTWIHGDPDIPFPPHEALDGLSWVDTEPDELQNPDSFPEGDVYEPGDHDGCTCWLDKTYEPYDGDLGNTTGNDVASTLANAEA